MSGIVCASRADQDLPLCDQDGPARWACEMRQRPLQCTDRRGKGRVQFLSDRWLCSLPELYRRRIAATTTHLCLHSQGEPDDGSFVEGRADGAGWYVSEQAKIATALFRALRDAQSNGPLRGGKADAAATARRMRAQRQRDAEAAAAAAAAEEESAPIASPVPTPAAVAMAAQAEAAAAEASADDDEAQ